MSPIKLAPKKSPQTHEGFFLMSINSQPKEVVLSLSELLEQAQEKKWRNPVIFRGDGVIQVGVESIQFGGMEKERYPNIINTDDCFEVLLERPVNLALLAKLLIEKIGDIDLISLVLKDNKILVFKPKFLAV